MDIRVERLLENEGVVHDVISEDLEYPCDPFVPDYELLDDESAWIDIESKRNVDDHASDGIFRIRSDETDDQLTFYLSCLISTCEYSSRGVYVTSLIIKRNPANYTAWTYRMDCAEKLQLSLSSEMDFVRKIAFESPKSYQAWQYRRRLCELHNHSYTELDYVKYEITSSPKNHCAWSHLTWLMSNFPVTKEQALKEAEFVEFLLANDVYNNTAWVYKIFLFNHCGNLCDLDLGLRGFAADLQKLLDSPWNESLANYLIHLITVLGRTHNGCLQLSSCQDDCTGGIAVCSMRAVESSGIISMPVLFLKKHLAYDKDRCRQTEVELEIIDPLRF